MNARRLPVSPLLSHRESQSALAKAFDVAMDGNWGAHHIGADIWLSTANVNLVVGNFKKKRFAKFVAAFEHDKVFTHNECMIQ